MRIKSRKHWNKIKMQKSLSEQMRTLCRIQQVTMLSGKLQGLNFLSNILLLVAIWIHGTLQKVHTMTVPVVCMLLKYCERLKRLGTNQDILYVLCYLQMKKIAGMGGQNMQPKQKQKMKNIYLVLKAMPVGSLRAALALGYLRIN